MSLKIERMFAYVATDEDGNEGVAAHLDPTMGWMPLVGADEERMESLRPVAEMLANAGNVDIALIKFETRVEIETIHADPSQRDAGVVILDPERSEQ